MPNEIEAEEPTRDSPAAGGRRPSSLLECPFCGGAGELKKTRHGEPVMKWVECIACGASATDYHDPDAAMRAWNHRMPGHSNDPAMAISREETPTYSQNEN